MVRSTAGGQGINVDILLADEPETIADRARRQLERPTDFIGDTGNPLTAERTTTGSPTSLLSLHDGQLDVPLDALVVAWFAARGYVARPAPASAKPFGWLLYHREDRTRNYAFFFDRGWLTARRAAPLLDRARELGMRKLLVAAEHGSDPEVGSARLRDVQVMDWPTIDREIGKLDPRVAAKILSIARARREMPIAA
jgi:hypothetical protein